MASSACMKIQTAEKSRVTGTVKAYYITAAHLCMMSGFFYSKKEEKIMLSKKYNAAEAEAKWQEFWQEKGIYRFDGIIAHQIKKYTMYAGKIHQQILQLDDICWKKRPAKQ